jgi:Xaa-Pro aminopeptidase
MRRGLISWSRAELPEAVLDARIAAVQAAMTHAGLHALAVYTTPARAAGVAWLAGFVPYWNQGLLIVEHSGKPLLVSALSNRVNGWMRRNAHVRDVRNAPRIGAEAARVVAESTPKARIGIVDMAHLPAAVVADLASTGHILEDASALLARLRGPADAADIALHCRAATIARQALAAISANETDAAAVAALVDGEARRLGAEEAYAALGPDLARSRRLARLEGTAALGPAWAIRLSVAYKGAWVRLTRTVARDPAQCAAIATAAEQLATAAARLPDTRALARAQSWLVEATRTTAPLEPVAGAMIDDPVTLPPGAIANLQATFAIDGAHVLVGAPALVGRDGMPSSLLVAADWR